MTLIELMNLVLRYRRLIVILSTAGFLVMAAVALAHKRTWTASASFAPQSNESSRSGLAGMAAQLGLPVQASSGRSPAFYAQLVTSRSVLDSVLSPTFKPSGDETGATLAREIAPKVAPERAKSEAMRQLKNGISVSTGRETGLIRVDVSLHDPVVARKAVTRILDVVNEINLDQRRQLAAQEREFAEDRLKEVRSELNTAEQNVRVFLEHNRQFQGSPALVFEHSRLEREVAYRQQIYTALAQSYEQARMDEVRNIPMIGIVENATAPQEPDGRGVAKKAALGFFGGGMLALVLAAILDGIRRARQANSAEIAEFDALRPGLLPGRRPGK
jgi:uncharacterized protein involved in exopolysaccharide biosynthesis